MPLYDRLVDWPRRPAGLPAVDRLQRILLADPASFRVAHAINPFMRGEDGELQQVDPDAAQRQWESLRAAYIELELEVATLAAAPELVDLCFTANPSLFLSLPGGGLECWLSKMAHASRHAEVALHEAFARQRGITLRRLPESVQRFEGCGDGLHHPGRFLLHAGIGPRSERAGWEALAEQHPQLDILCYEPVDEHFYHLDTALAPLNEDAALVVREAFSPEGYAMIRAAFPAAIDVPHEEALRFAANAHCPDGRHVLIERDTPQTQERLVRAGFQPIPLETSEFRKSGGSVFCLKQTF